jgi:hypothetical protein
MDHIQMCVDIALQFVHATSKEGYLSCSFFMRFHRFFRFLRFLRFLVFFVFFIF